MGTKKAWRWSDGSEFVMGFAVLLSVLFLLVITRDDDYFCSDTDDFGRGFGLVIILMFSTPIVALVAVRRLLVHDKVGFAWLAVLVASIGLVAATLGNTSFCPS
jgi:hypothetical protein